MKYYLVISDDLKKSTPDLFDTKYLLVDVQFDNAYTGSGFKIFENIIEKDKHLDKIKIYDENKNELSIAKFLNEIEEFNLITQ